ncbi:hypothetical protein, partial [Nonomuraea dietziae]|uniref:hypothetical protein n=1 Tax=Nonomuraea dietziae TaxID=65515 RepID=UPI00340B3ED8
PVYQGLCYVIRRTPDPRSCRDQHPPPEDEKGSLYLLRSTKEAIWRYRQANRSVMGFTASSDHWR